MVLAFTPPQAWQARGWKTKLRQELPKLVGPKCLREDVSRLKVHIDVLKVDIPHKDTFSSEVVMHLNLLTPSMEYRIPSKMDIVEIVAVDQDWIVDGDV